jgi:hypothetical protein
MAKEYKRNKKREMKEGRIREMTIGKKLRPTD